MAAVNGNTVSNKGFALAKLADTAKKKLKLILGIGVVKNENIANGAVGISKLDEEVQDALAGVPSGTGLISRVESLEEHTIKDNETTQEVYGDFEVCANGARKGIFTEKLTYYGGGRCRTELFHMETSDKITGVDFESTSFLEPNPTWTLYSSYDSSYNIVKTGAITSETPVVDLSDVVFQDSDYFFEIMGMIPDDQYVNIFFSWEFLPSSASGALLISKGVKVKPSLFNPVSGFGYIEDNEGNSLQESLNDKLTAPILFSSLSSGLKSKIQPTIIINTENISGHYDTDHPNLVLYNSIYTIIRPGTWVSEPYAESGWYKVTPGSTIKVTSSVGVLFKIRYSDGSGDGIESVEETGSNTRVSYTNTGDTVEYVDVYCLTSDISWEYYDSFAHTIIFEMASTNWLDVFLQDHNDRINQLEAQIAALEGGSE